MQTLDELFQNIDFSMGCWNWLAYRDRDGYGTVRWLGKKRRTHRVMFSIYKHQPVLDLDHLCRNRGCVNPWHLEEVTPKENIARGNNPGSIMLRTNKCQYGHSDIRTTIVNGRSKRYCAECRRRKS